MHASMHVESEVRQDGGASNGADSRQGGSSIAHEYDGSGGLRFVGCGGGGDGADGGGGREAKAEDLLHHHG